MRIALAVILAVPFSAPAQEATARLTGTVVDQTGAYVPRAAVELEGTVKYRVQADESGVYQFANLLPGVYALTFRSPAFTPLTVKSITVLEGERKRLSDVTLHFESGCGEPVLTDLRLLDDETSFGSLVGNVSRGPSTPVEGVDVTLVCRTFSSCGSTKTDAQGRFSFRMLSSGKYGLSFKREGYYLENATGYQYIVNAGWESVYGPVMLEKCPNGNCDPKLRPPRPIQYCE